MAKVLKAMGQHLNIKAHVGAIPVNHQYRVAMHAVAHSAAIDILIKTGDSVNDFICMMLPV